MYIDRPLETRASERRRGTISSTCFRKFAEYGAELLANSVIIDTLSK